MIECQVWLGAFAASGLTGSIVRKPRFLSSARADAADPGTWLPFRTLTVIDCGRTWGPLRLCTPRMLSVARSDDWISGCMNWFTADWIADCDTCSSLVPVM